MNECKLLGRTLKYRPLTVTTPDGLRIAVQDWGQPGRGRDVLLIHGFSQAGLCWFPQFSGPLAQRHRLVTYDLRGHGASDKPLDPACYREPKRWADEVAAVIDAARLVQPVLVAWSYAGRVVLDYLAEYGSDAVSGLVMVAAASTAEPSTSGPSAPLMTQMCNAKDLVENLTATESFIDACVSRPVSAEARALMLGYNMLVPVPVRAALRGRPADYVGLLSRLTIPLLAIHGREDRINLPAMTQHTLAHCPSARALFYDGIGHTPFWEAADRFDHDVSGFIAQLRVPAAACN